MSTTEPTAAKPPCLHEDALQVLSTLRGRGHVAYFAGGCVRDLLLGLEPKDWDIATDAPPKRVREIFPHTQAVGAAFGVILVRQGQSTIEVATFRSDGAYSDGRRPDEITFTTPEHDAQRRDFTINGLFLDPAGPPNHPRITQGAVIDFVGGVEDLDHKLLRAIGDAGQRFGEDHLRLLRAVRFAARFGFAIEESTAKAIKLHAPRLRGISPERIAGELRLMLTGPSRGLAYQRLWDFGLLAVMLRFLEVRGPLEIPERPLFMNTRPGEGIAFSLALVTAALDCVMGRGGGNVMTHFERKSILNIGKAMREALKISNEELAEVTGMMEPLVVLLVEPLPRVAVLKRFLARPTCGLSRQLLDGIAATGHQTDLIARLQTRLDELARGDCAPVPFINGDDLSAAGLRPGPDFRRIIDEIYDAQLEGRLRDRPAALEMLAGMKSNT